MKGKPELKLRLLYWRTRRALNVRELASKSKVSSTTIVRIEKGDYIPRTDVIRRLADALNVPLDDMWEEVKHPKRAAVKVA